MPMPDNPKKCTGPGLNGAGCTRDAGLEGLCAPHRNQARRHPGRPLKPLRGPCGLIGTVRQVKLPGLAVSRECADWLEASPEGVCAAARRVLEAAHEAAHACAQGA